MNTQFQLIVKTIPVFLSLAVLPSLLAAQPEGSTNRVAIPPRPTSRAVTASGVVRTNTNPALRSVPVLPNAHPTQAVTSTVSPVTTTVVAAHTNAPVTNANNVVVPVIPGVVPTTAVRTAVPTTATPPSPTAVPVIPTARPITPVSPTPAPTATATALPTAAKSKPAEEIVPLINFDNMPLGQVLDFYTDLVGKTILRASNLPVTSFITLKSKGPLTKSEAITALETVMAMNGYTVIPIGDKFIKVVTGGEAPTAGGEFSTGDPKDLPVSGKFVTQIIQLKNVPVKDAVTVITPFASGKTGASIVPIETSQTIVLRDYSENVKRMMEMIDKVDLVSELVIKPEVIPIKYALATDIQQVLGSLTAGGGGGLTVGRNSRSGLSGGGSTGSPSTGGGFNNQGQQGQPYSNPSNPGGMTGGGSASSRVSSFQSRLNSIVNRASSSGDFQILGEAKIIADERTNSLLIFANDQDMIMIKTIIAQLDVVLAQVLIEALIVEVSLNDIQDMGVSYIQKPKPLGGGLSGAGGVNNGQPFLNPKNFLANISGGSNAVATTAAAGITNLPSGFSYFANIGDFDVAVTALAQDSRANVLSRPRIQTSHAVEARLFIGDTVPYLTGTYSYAGQANSQIQQKEVGIALNVLPLINVDGLVVMDISQNIEQVTGNFKVDANTTVPLTSKREALAKVAVRDRETIALGGFISTSKTQNKSGVPYLKDIPYLGALFRSKNDNGKRVELMVFLRPTVLPTPEAASLAASDERDKLPGIKQAEFEIREEERRRNEKIETDMRKKLGLKDPKSHGK